MCFCVWITILSVFQLNVACKVTYFPVTYIEHQQERGRFDAASRDDASDTSTGTTPFCANRSLTL